MNACFYTPPENGELMFSWLTRVCRQNLISTEDMRRIFMGDDCNLFSPDISIPVSPVMKAMGMDTEKQITAFLETTLYPLIGFCRTPAVCQQIISSVFTPKMHLPAAGKYASRIVYLCPECVKEELSEKGYYTARRIHQVPGVEVCTKHHVPLVTASVFQVKDMTGMPAMKSIRPSMSTENSLLIAKFAGDLLEKMPDINLFQMVQAVRLREDMINWQGTTLLEALKEKGFGDLFAGYNDDQLSHCIFDKQHPCMDRRLAILYTLFGSADEFISSIPEKTDEEERELSENLLAEGYRLSGSYRRDVISVTHMACGHTFAISPYGFFRMGIRCPECSGRIPEEERLRGMIRASAPKNTMIVTPVGGMRKKISVETADGKERICTPFDIIYRRKLSPKVRSKMGRYIKPETKRKEKRGKGDHETYKPWIYTAEVSSSGTKCNFIDWKTGRMVELLSQGEKDYYCILRWDDSVDDINEQYPLNIEETNEIAKRIYEETGKEEFLPLSHLNQCMTTDLLVTYTDGSQRAFSVKYDKESLKKKDVARFMVEKLYWKKHNASYRIVFREDVDRDFVSNICAVVPFYDEKYVVTELDAFKHEIARKKIDVDFHHGPVRFVKLLKEYKGEGRWKKESV